MLKWSSYNPIRLWGFCCGFWSATKQKLSQGGQKLGLCKYWYVWTSTSYKPKIYLCWNMPSKDKVIIGSSSFMFVTLLKACLYVLQPSYDHCYYWCYFLSHIFYDSMILYCLLYLNATNLKGLLHWGHKKVN